MQLDRGKPSAILGTAAPRRRIAAMPALRRINLGVLARPRPPAAVAHDITRCVGAIEVEFDAAHRRAVTLQFRCHPDIRIKLLEREFRELLAVEIELEIAVAGIADIVGRGVVGPELDLELKSRLLPARIARENRGENKEPNGRVMLKFHREL